MQEMQNITADNGTDIRSFVELYKAYPEERNEMSQSREQAFVKECFKLYENHGFSKRFHSPYEDKESFNGSLFEVIRRVDTEIDRVDLECLPQWIARFPNGDEFPCYPEEICILEEINKPTNANFASTGQNAI